MTLKERFRVSWSKIKVWRRCHKAHDYRYNQNLERKRKAAPLLRGIILHDMLNSRALVGMGRKIDDEGKKVESPKKVLAAAEKQYKRLFTEEQDVYGDMIGDIEKIWGGYDREYANDPLTYLGSEEEIITEVAPGIDVIAYIDKRVKDSRGLKWIVDHKSHKNLPDEEDRFSDLQLVQYVWMWNRENPKRAVDGILWDYLRTKPPTVPETLKAGGITKRANIDTDYYTYAKAIEDNKLDPADYQEILENLYKTPSNFFKRVYLPKPSTAMLSEVVADLRDTAIQIAEHGTKMKDRNMTRDCSHMCEFYNLCQSELRGLDSNYVRKADYQTRKEEKDEKAAKVKGKSESVPEAGK